MMLLIAILILGNVILVEGIYKEDEELKFKGGYISVISIMLGIFNLLLVG